MSFAESVARQQEAVFRTLGEDATWSGVVGTVRVRRREADEVLPFTHGGAIVDGHRIKVRKSDVSAPAIGDTLQILDLDGDPVDGGAFVVVGEPMLDRKGVWTCPVRPSE